jgi:hypothetical protein
VYKFVEDKLAAKISEAKVELEESN